MYAIPRTPSSSRKSASEPAPHGAAANAPVQTILVVEDETDLREMVADALELAGYQVLQAASIAEARRHTDAQPPDLILLDWMLPDTSGIDWLRQLRRSGRFPALPIILLTARGEVSDRVAGLDSGADDYLVKPFSLKELQARIRAQLRKRQGDSDQEQYSVGDLVLDIAMHRVTSSGNEVALSPTEFRLLRHFVTHPERVYTRSQLLDTVWGQQVFIEERTVDVHIRRLRKALEPHGKANLIQTVRGSGYRFSPRGG